MSNQAAIDRAVFAHYEDGSFDIQGKGLSLAFTHSYHSERLEIPYLSYDNPSYWEYQKLYGNQTTNKYQYDAIGRPTGMISTNRLGDTIVRLSAVLDKLDNHTQETVFVKSLDTATFKNSPAIEDISYNYNNTNRLQTFGTTSLSHDNNGNQLTQSGTPQYNMTWDSRDNLLTCQIGATNNSFEYDPLENRRKVNNTRYLLDVLSGSNVLTDLNPNNTPLSIWVHGLGLVCRIDPSSNQVSYFHYDFRGSTIAVTDTGHEPNRTNGFSY